MKLKYLSILLFLVLLGCSQTDQNTIETIQSVDIKPEPTITEAMNLQPSPVSATATLIPPTPSPTTAPFSATPTPSYRSFGQRNVAAQDRGGVVVEVAWIQIGDRQAFEQNLAELEFETSEMLEDKQALVWLVFNISNYSGKGFHLHPRRGTVIVNEEPIDLSTYDTYTDVDENFDGAYGPGEEVVGGGIWFGIENSSVDEITEIIIQMHGPHFYVEDVYAAEYNFVLDLSDHVSEEMPDYLK